MTVAGGGTIALAPSASSGYSSMGFRVCTASTNAASIKTSSGNLGMLRVANLGATTVYLKLYNKASAPVPASDTPVLVIPVGAGQHLDIDVPAAGLRFSTGIAMTCVAGIANNDATAIAADTVVVNWSYV